MRVKGKWSKGEMARTIVIYLLRLLTMVRRSTCPTCSATPGARQ